MERLTGGQSHRGTGVLCDSASNRTALLSPCDLTRLEAMMADTDYRIIGDSELYFQNSVIGERIAKKC